MLDRIWNDIVLAPILKPIKIQYTIMHHGRMRTISADSYASTAPEGVLRLTYNHPSKKKLILEQNLVMEQKLCRVLNPTECVAHLNGDKTDNRIENLILLKKSDIIPPEPIKRGARRSEFEGDLLLKIFNLFDKYEDVLKFYANADNYPRAVETDFGMRARVLSGGMKKEFSNILKISGHLLPHVIKLKLKGGSNEMEL